MTLTAVLPDIDALRERFGTSPGVVDGREPILSPADAFALAVAASQAQVAGTAPGEVKLYVDGEQIIDRLAELLPCASDGDAAGYEQRLRRDAGAASFTLYASAAQAYSPALFDAGRHLPAKTPF